MMAGKKAQVFPGANSFLFLYSTPAHENVNATLVHETVTDNVIHVIVLKIMLTKSLTK
jgi:hypothetical protein